MKCLSIGTLFYISSGSFTTAETFRDRQRPPGKYARNKRLRPHKTKPNAAAAVKPTRNNNGAKQLNSPEEPSATGRGAAKSSKSAKGTKSSKSISKSAKNRSNRGDMQIYEADLGDNGTFRMTVESNGEATYEADLKELDELPLDTVIGDSLAYHLHSGKIGPGGECVPTYTKGHYDPRLKCGGASTAPLCDDVEDGVPCCAQKPAEDYCSDDNIESCEIGDLSGLHGRIEVKDGRAVEDVKSGRCPGCIADYSPEASGTDGSAAYNTWASVVFHGIDGQRVLCADLVKA